jgi:hypothetical protein
MSLVLEGHVGKVMPYKSVVHIRYPAVLMNRRIASVV